MPQRVDDWLNEGRAELRASQTLYEGGHWSWCCFTCHQAAEKALKAVCEHRRTPQFGHNLNLLLRAAGEHGEVVPELQGAVARLNRFYIPTRYPDAFPEGVPADQFFEQDARQALDDARYVLRWAEDRTTDA